jgi:hypothetical protein
MIGHRRYGKKFTLKPVNNEMIDRALSMMMASQYTVRATRLAGSTSVTAAINTPMKIQCNPFVDPLHGDDALIVERDVAEAFDDVPGGKEMGHTPRYRQEGCEVKENASVHVNAPVRFMEAVMAKRVRPAEAPD